MHTTLATLLLALAVTATLTSAEGPCDITGAANNPCVAAHSTVRGCVASGSGSGSGSGSDSDSDSDSDSGLDSGRPIPN